MQTGVDVGGTFTDVVAWDGEVLRTGKVATSADQGDGVVDGMRRIAGDVPGTLLHGTTTATNALLERSGARTALLTDTGFEDLIEIGRQDRPSLYDTSHVRSAPLVDRDLRIGVPGRSGTTGARTGDVDLESLTARLADLSPDAIAISTLFGFVNPTWERGVGRVLSRALGIPVSVASDVVAEFREFERASTTIINAYLLPAVERYLSSLTAKAEAAGVHGTVAVMRSSGGLIAAEEASRLPAAILLSGPAGGVVAATALGQALGRDHLISFDMGGTSTDVCRIDHGRPEVTYERSIDGLPCRMPAVAIHTVGAGGGSIGWVDAGGALRVGPRSAGAIPGPACYGRGGNEPAVTDANLILGRISAAARLAGTMALDADASAAALAAVGRRTGLTPAEVALGMVEVVESHMERAIRRVSVEEGADPRRAVLVAFGGAGGLHATALARSLDMDGVVVPAHAGVFSALGLLLAPPRADAAHGVLITQPDSGDLDRELERVAEGGRDALRRAGATGSSEVVTFADVRYLGQAHETTVRVDAAEPWEVLEERFHRAHRERNGFARAGDPIEVVAVRAEATGEAAVRWEDLPLPVPEGDSRLADRSVLTPAGPVEAAGWWRPALRPGDEVVGPAVIEESEATTYLALGERAVVHPSGALEVGW